MSDDDLGDCQLNDTTGVRVRGIEHGNGPIRGGIEVDLVRTDAKGANGEQRVGGIEHPPGDLGLGPDAKQVDSSYPLAELVLARCPVEAFDLESSLVQQRNCVAMNVLYKKCFHDYTLGEVRVGAVLAIRVAIYEQQPALGRESSSLDGDGRDHAGRRVDRGEEVGWVARRRWAGRRR